MVDVNINTTLDDASTASKHCAGFSYKQGRMIYNMYTFILNIAVHYNFKKITISITFLQILAQSMKHAHYFMTMCCVGHPLQSIQRIEYLVL